MTTTTTSNFQLQKIDDGTESDTWGARQREDQDRLDDILGGYLSISVAGPSDVTLTEAQYDHQSLEFTGTLTGNISIIFPAYQRMWRVYNNTSGAFSVTVKVAGQTGFEITQGRRYTIQGNSTDVVKELSDDLTEINALIDDLSGVTDVEGARVNLEVDRPVQTKTTDYTQVATDVNNMIRWTSAGTYDLLAAATAGNDFSVDLMADGGTITIDPDGAELVNGAATVAVSDGDSGTLFCDGTAWYFLIGGGGGGSYKGENGTVSSANVGDIFRVHEQELNTSTTIAATENALCAGPLTVASGITLTVTSGGTLVIA